MIFAPFPDRFKFVFVVSPRRHDEFLIRRKFVVDELRVAGDVFQKAVDRPRSASLAFAAPFVKRPPTRVIRLRAHKRTEGRANYSVHIFETARLRKAGVPAVVAALGIDIGGRYKLFWNIPRSLIDAV